MKKLLYPLCLALALSACEETNTTPEPDPDPSTTEDVSFSSTIDGGSYFATGDEISVFAYEGEDQVAGNVKYRFANEQFTSDDPIEYEDEEQNLAFYAIYPYATTVAESFSFTAAEDQSTEAAYLASDLLAATIASAHNATPTLPFYHKFAKVVVNIDEADVDVTDAVITFSAKTSADCDIVAGTYTTSGDNADIVAYQSGDSQYSAVVAPQTFAAGAVVVSVEVDGVIYTWKATGDIELGSGEMYTCELTLIEGEITLTGQIEDWAEGEEVEGGSNKDTNIEPVTITLVSTSTSDIVVNVDLGDYDGLYYVGLWWGGLEEDEILDAARELVYDEFVEYGTDFSAADGYYVFDQDNIDISIADGWGLYSGYDYTVLAMCVSELGVITSNVAYVEAETVEVVVAGSIDVTVVSVDEEDIVINANPSSEIENYIVGAIPTSDYTNLEGSYLGNRYTAAAAIIYTLEYNGIDLSTADGEIVFTGQNEIHVGNIWSLSTSTDYSIFTFAVDDEGNIVSSITVTTATTLDKDWGEIDGTLELTIKEATSFNVAVDVAITGNVGIYYLAPYFKDYFERDFNGDLEALAAAMIQNEIDVYGTNFSKTDGYWLFDSAMSNYNMGDNSAWVFSPDFDYIIVAFGVNSSGEVTTDIAYTYTYTGVDNSATTPTSDYSAIAGEWTMTSWDSYNNNSYNEIPITYDVTLEEYGINDSYLLTGWGSQSIRNSVPIVAYFDELNGSFNIKGKQRLANDTGTDYCLRSKGYTSLDETTAIINFEYDIIYGLLQDDGTIWCVTTSVYSGGVSYFIEGIEMYELDDAGNLITLPFADGYTENPIGPYGMVKKTADGAPQQASSFVRLNSVDYIRFAQIESMIPDYNEKLHGIDRLQPVAAPVVSPVKEKLSVKELSLRKR